MIVLSKKQIIMLHHQLILETGGTDGIRDEGLLESALEAPLQSFDGIELNRQERCRFIGIVPDLDQGVMMVINLFFMKPGCEYIHLDIQK